MYVKYCKYLLATNEILRDFWLAKCYSGSTTHNKQEIPHRITYRSVTDRSPLAAKTVRHFPSDSQ